MAIRYRVQLYLTGERAKEEVAAVVARPEYCRGIGNAQAYLHGWYVKLSKALGSENGLEELKKSWTTLSELNKFVRPHHRRRENIPVEKYDRILELIRTAQNQLNRFLQDLPQVTEKCLTHAVNNSGIEL